MSKANNKMIVTNPVILILTVLINGISSLHFFNLAEVILLKLGDMCSPVVKAGNDYVPVANSWLRLHEIPATWQDAALQCHLEDGQLASPTSVELASAMKAMLAARGLALGSAYTGLHDTIAKGYYTTLDGIPLANISQPWAPGEPDNQGNAEDCLTMSGTGELADVNCNTTYPYFCQKSSENMIVNSCGTTAKGYKRDQTTGSCYKFHVTARAWHRAAAACAAARAHLAVVNSEQESEALQQLIKLHHKPNDRLDIVHIGFSYWKAADEYFTIFGKTLDEAGFSKWNQNEPNNFGGSEFCGSLIINGLLNDISCDEKRAFICEITP